MSVMILSNEYYNRIFNTLNSPKYKVNGGKDSLLPFGVDLYGYFGRSPFPFEDTIKTAHRLNHLSYDVKYSDCIEVEELELISDHTNRFKNHCELLKALQCIDYQIEIDSIEHFEQMKGVSLLNENDRHRFKGLQNLIKAVQSLIIHQLPDYQAAKWGKLENEAY